MLPMMVSALSSEMAFSWDCACNTRQAEYSRLRMVATSFSSLGIWPMLAHSSMRQRTWTGNRPPYTSSAFSAQEVEQLGVAHGDQEVKAIVRVAHNEEQSGFPISQGVQLQLVVGSDLPQFRGMLNTARRAPQEIRMDFAVLPAASLYSCTGGQRNGWASPPPAHQTSGPPGS